MTIWGGLKKIGRAVKNGANWFYHKILKPAAHVLADPLKQVVQAVVPGPAGKVISSGIDYVSKLAGGKNSTQSMVGANGHGVRVPPDIISKKIALK